MWTTSLRSRTIGTGVVAVALVLTVLDLVLYVSLDRELRQTTEAVLQERLAVAAALAQQHPAEDLAAELQALGISAVVTHPDGSTDLGAPPSAVLAGGLPATHDPAGPKLTGEIVHADGSTAAVSVSRAGSIRVMDFIRTLLVVSTLLAIAVAALLLRRGATVALRPLDAVVDAARRVAGGEHGVRVSPAQPDTDVGVVGAAFDGVVDSLESAMAESRQQVRANERFVADAAHQLRTPITGIQASAEALALGLDEAGRRAAVSLIVSQTSRVAVLLSGLLRLAKLDMGELPRQEVVDLGTICATEVQRARASSPGPDVSLRGGTGGAVPIELDPTTMREALANLLDNACRHARADVSVELAVEEPEIVVRVRDDGDGVAEADVDPIFQRFVSLDHRGGSGLGLPIARAIVGSHGGTLRYEGGAFVIRLARERRHRPRLSAAGSG